MKNREYEEEYLIYEKKIKALSDNTIKAYSSDLNLLLSFSEERDLEFSSFSNDDAREFMRQMERDKKAEKSRLRILTCCHTLTILRNQEKWILIHSILFPFALEDEDYHQC